MFFHLLREESFFLGIFLWDILSALFLSLFTVYFVVRCCDICGVLMYLFILFQLCRIYNEKNPTKLFCVFLFPASQQAIYKKKLYHSYFLSLSQNCFEIIFF